MIRVKNSFRDFRNIRKKKHFVFSLLNLTGSGSLFDFLLVQNRKLHQFVEYSLQKQHIMKIIILVCSMEMGDRPAGSVVSV